MYVVVLQAGVTTARLLPSMCRLEVGTESSLDRSKPVRSYLMPLFPGNSSIEVRSQSPFT